MRCRIWRFGHITVPCKKLDVRPVRPQVQLKLSMKRARPSLTVLAFAEPIELLIVADIGRLHHLSMRLHARSIPHCVLAATFTMLSSASWVQPCEAGVTSRPIRQSPIEGPAAQVRVLPCRAESHPKTQLRTTEHFEKPRTQNDWFGCRTPRL